MTLTREGRELLDAHALERDDDASQTFYAGVSRERELPTLVVAEVNGGDQAFVAQVREGGRS